MSVGQIQGFQSGIGAAVKDVFLGRNWSKNMGLERVILVGVEHWWGKYEVFKKQVQRCLFGGRNWSKKRGLWKVILVGIGSVSGANVRLSEFNAGDDVTFLHLFWCCWRRDPLVPRHRYLFLYLLAHLYLFGYYWIKCNITVTHKLVLDGGRELLWLLLHPTTNASSHDSLKWLIVTTIVTKICLAEPPGFVHIFSPPFSVYGGWVW